MVNGNINILFDNNSKSQLDAVLYCYNLACIIKFLTRIVLHSPTAIGDEIIDSSSIGKYDLYPLINGLSYHDVQLVIINKVQKQGKECLADIKGNK